MRFHINPAQKTVAKIKLGKSNIALSRKYFPAHVYTHCGINNEGM